MFENRICTRSCNCAAYLCYSNRQHVDIVHNETGLKMWSFEDTDYNREAYNKYKSAVSKGDRLNVDLVKFNKILRFLKNMSKNYEYERVDEDE